MKDQVIEGIRVICKDQYHDPNTADLSGDFPRQTWQKLADLGVLSLPVPAQRGGMEFSPVDVTEVIEALGYHSEDAGLNFAICAQLFGCVIPLAESDQHAYALQAIMKGKICAHGMTEASAGSNVFAMRSTATPTGTGYRIQASKTFCTQVDRSDYMILYALTDANKGAHGGISAFLLNREEYEVTETYEKMGLRSCSIGSVRAEQEIIGDRMIGREGAGFVGFSTAMNWERVGMSACQVGSMQRILEKVVDYVRSRDVGGELLAHHQAIRFKIADMQTHVAAARLMVQKAASGLEGDRTVARQAAMCKLFVSEHYVDLCRQAMQIFGGNGYMRAYGLERHMRDALASTIYSGTSEIQKKIIAGWEGL